MNIGDIYNVYFDGKGSEQRGVRPAIIVQSVKGIKHSPIIKVIPLTASSNKLEKHFQKPEPFHVFLSAEKYGLRKDSLALCEQAKKVTKEDILEKISIQSLPTEVMREISIAQCKDDPTIAFLDVDDLMKLISELRAENKICVTCA